MTEQELRALVRNALAHHAGASFASGDAHGRPAAVVLVHSGDVPPGVETRRRLG